MEMSEIKAAFHAGTPVVYRDVEYSCISALIYRKIGGHEIVQAELADRHGNSITIACPNWITAIGIQGGEEIK